MKRGDNEIKEGIYNFSSLNKWGQTFIPLWNVADLDRSKTPEDKITILLTSNPIDNSNRPTMFGSSFTIGDDILDIGSAKFDRRSDQRAIGSGAMIPSLALGEPGQFEVPNVADVSLFYYPTLCYVADDVRVFELLPAELHVNIHILLIHLWC